MDAALAEVDAVEPVVHRAEHIPHDGESERARHVEADGHEQGAGDARDEVAVASGGPSEHADGGAEDDERHGEADDEADAVEEGRPAALNPAVLDGDAGEMAEEDRDEGQDAGGDERGDPPNESYDQGDE